MPQLPPRSLVRTLIVDDLASSRRAMTTVIEYADGFAVSGQADCGEAALELLGHLPVELVLMDVHMPGMGGIRTAAEIRRIFPSIKVVLLSVDHWSELRQAAELTGAQFCHKDHFEPSRLKELWQGDQ